MNEFLRRLLSRKIIKLAIACSVLLIVWLVLLPWLAAQPSVESRLDFLDQNGIDASAMYYTELECMDAILEKIEGRTAKTSAKLSRRR
jgi:hypothetical protein